MNSTTCVVRFLISTTCVVCFLISTTCVVCFLISTTCVVSFLISTTCVVCFLISTTCVANCPRTGTFLLLMSNTTTVACCAADTRPVVAPRHRRMSAFFPARSDPRSARLGCSLWFSNRNKSAMLASGRDCSDRNSCMTKIMTLYRCTPTSFLLFSRSSGRLAKVNMLFRLMISYIGTDESSSLSRTNAA